MGKKNPPARSGKQDGKAVNKSKTDYVEIDWDEVAELSVNNTSDVIPENAITIAKVSKQFGIEASSAGRRLMVLEKTGLYEIRRAKQGAHNVKYLIRKSNKPLRKGQTK